MAKAGIGLEKLKVKVPSLAEKLVLLRKVSAPSTTPLLFASR